MVTSRAWPEAEAWFRQRGLPCVVRGHRAGAGLIVRSIPLLTWYVLTDVLLTLVDDLPGLDVVAGPDELELGIDLLALGVLAALIVVPVLVAWFAVRAVSRAGSRGRLVLCVAVPAVLLVVDPIVQSIVGQDLSWRAALAEAIIVLAVVLLLARIGAGAILGWACRTALRNLGAVGRMASRGLPLLILVVLATFFDNGVWRMAGELPRWRLWGAAAFLIMLTVLFLRSVQSEELRGLIGRGHAVAGEQGDIDRLAGTPFAAGAVVARGAARLPLRRRERANLSLVFFCAQATQIAVFMLLVFTFFVVFGAIAVLPETQTAWVGRPPEPGRLFGIELPVSNELIQVSIFETMFSGLYFAAAGATDAQYRAAFFEPLVTDLRVSLAARDVYLAGHPG